MFFIFLFCHKIHFYGTESKENSFLCVCWSQMGKKAVYQNILLTWTWVIYSLFQVVWRFFFKSSTGSFWFSVCFLGWWTWPSCTLLWIWTLDCWDTAFCPRQKDGAEYFLNLLVPCSVADKITYIPNTVQVRKLVESIKSKPTCPRLLCSN